MALRSDAGRGHIRRAIACIRDTKPAARERLSRRSYKGLMMLAGARAAVTIAMAEMQAMFEPEGAQDFRLEGYCRTKAGWDVEISFLDADSTPAFALYPALARTARTIIIGDGAIVPMG